MKRVHPIENKTAWAAEVSLQVHSWFMLTTPNMCLETHFGLEHQYLNFALNITILEAENYINNVVQNQTF